MIAPPITGYNYHTALTELGCTYLGPCSCRHRRGYMYRSPQNDGTELWVYPSANLVRKRVYDQTKEQLPYTAESFVQIVKAMMGL